LKIRNRTSYNDLGLVFAKEWGDLHGREESLGLPLQIGNFGQREFSGQNPHGYPPHAEYRFEDRPRPGFLVLASGPHPVFSHGVTTEFQYGTSEIGIGGPTDADRIAYLDAMRARVEPGPVSGLRAATIESVRWSTPAALLQRVRELRGEIERPYQFLQSSLVRAYGLSSSAMKPPQIEIRLIDKRKDRSVPLPSVSAERRHPEP
jgi:hypothetical protein